MSPLAGPVPHEPRRCAATNRQGLRCGRFAMAGTTVCDVHGGKAPQVRRAAERRLATERARSELARLGEPAAPVTDPHGELARICGEAVALVDVLRRHVATVEDVAGPEVAAYLASLARAESALSAALRAGVEERSTRIAEEQGELLAGVLRNVIEWLFARWEAGVDVATVRGELPAVARRELLAVSERHP